MLAWSRLAAIERGVWQLPCGLCGAQLPLALRSMRRRATRTDGDDVARGDGFGYSADRRFPGRSGADRSSASDSGLDGVIKRTPSGSNAAGRARDGIATAIGAIGSALTRARQGKLPRSAGGGY